MMEFANILSASASVLPLDEFLKNGQKNQTRVLSFGLFSPLAHMILTAKGVKEAHILHPFFMDFGSQDTDFENLNSENAPSHKFSHLHFHTYEIGTEHAIAALLAHLDSENLDIGYISSESNFDEEEAQIVVDFLTLDSEISIILGRDLYLHENAIFIAQMICQIAQKSGAKIYLQDLDSEISQNTQNLQNLNADFSVLENLKECNGAIVYECGRFEILAFENMLFEKMLTLKQHDKDYRPFKRAQDYFNVADSENLIFAPKTFGAIFGKKPQSISTDENINFYEATIKGADSQKMCILDFFGTIGARKFEIINSYPFKNVISIV